MSEILTALGAGSGIDTGKIVESLLAAEREPKMERLSVRREALDAQISALGELRATVSAFSSALSSLTDSGLLGVKPRLSGGGNVTASIVSPDARPASLSFSVEALASRQTLVSGGFSNTQASALGTGTLTIRLGELAADAGGNPQALAEADPPRSATIHIDAAGQSLAAVAAQISSAGLGLAASVLNDGGTERLIVKSEEGAGNGFTIDVAADVAGAPLEKLAYNAGTSQMTSTQAAGDAQLLVEGVTVTRGSNRIEDLVGGVAFDLSEAEPGSALTYSADYDAPEIETAIKNFVGAYNELTGLMAQMSAPAAPGGEAGPLNGSRALRGLQRELNGLTTVPLLPGEGIARLADIGVSSSRSGQLSVDETVLRRAVAEAPERVTQMFRDNVTEGLSGIRFKGAAASAEAGRYEFEDVRLATSGTLTGTAAGTAFLTPLLIDSSNRDFRIAVDGASSLTVQMRVGSYTGGADFAAMLSDVIAQDELLQSQGLGADVIWKGDRLEFTSRSSGSASSVAVEEMQAALSTRVGLDSPAEQAGEDASATINGVKVTGAGNILTLPAGMAGAGMTFEVTRPLASALFEATHGLGTRLADIAASLAEPTGAIGGSLAALGAESSALTRAERALEERMERYETRLRAQYSAMEAAVASFKATQDFLDQQIEIWTAAGN